MLTGKNRQDSFRKARLGRPEKFFVASCISVLIFWLLRIRSWYFGDRTLCSRSLPLDFIAETVVEAHRCYFARAKYSRLTHEALAMPKVLDLAFNTR